MARSNWDVDCAVIGGGPGGLVSGLYLKRFTRSVVVFNAGKPRAAWIPVTQNLIGYSEGISGQALLRRIHRQLDKHGVERLDALASVVRHGRGFEISTGHHRITARKVILATGMRDLQPEVNNLDELRNLGLLRYCPVCDIHSFRGEPLAVIIQDHDGLERAEFICYFTRKLKIIAPESYTPRKKTIAHLHEMGARILHGRISAITPSRSPHGSWISVEGHRPFFVKATYVELGVTIPDCAFSHFKSIERTKTGFLLTTTEQRLSVPGLFAVGDCVNQLGQISVAAGQAAIAATAVHNDLLTEDRWW